MAKKVIAVYQNRVDKRLYKLYLKLKLYKMSPKLFTRLEMLKSKFKILY